MVPILALIVYGCLNVLVYFRTMNSLERTATSMGEVISRCSAVSTQDLNNFAVEAQVMAGGPPFSPLLDITGTSGAFIVTAIGNDSGTTPTIVWQKTYSSAVPTLVSRFGAVGQVPVNIGAYSLAKGQALIGVEVFNKTLLWQIGTPYLASATPSTLYTMSLFLVRSANPSTMETVNQGSATLCGT